MQVVLRPINFTDTANIIRWRNSQSVRQNFIDQSEITEEIHTNWLQNFVNTGKVVQFIIQVKNTDIGSVFLRNIDKVHNKAEFGIFIGEDLYRGKGLGTQATQQMIEYGFNTLHLHKIILRVLARNTRAIKTYKKVGFEQIGIFKDDVCISGKYENVVFMEILTPYKDTEQ